MLHGYSFRTLALVARRGSYPKKTPTRSPFERYQKELPEQLNSILKPKDSIYKLLDGIYQRFV